MKEKTILAIVLLAIGVVGFAGMAGLMTADTGMTIQTTSHLGSRGCMCDIYMYDYSGNLMGIHGQTIRVKTGGQLTDEMCDIRCNAHYGRSKSGRKKVDGRVM